MNNFEKKLPIVDTEQNSTAPQSALTCANSSNCLNELPESLGAILQQKDPSISDP